MTTPLQSTIEEKAAEALRLRSGDKEKANRSMNELIAADEYLANQGGSNKAKLPVRFFNTRPPGAA